MILLIYGVITFLFLKIKCSVVVDTMNQKGIHISDYCPKMEFCAEGAHVMCMYYDPQHVMGPKCSNPKNVSITPDLANKLLDITNALRSKIAMGIERGKNGQTLPRGYGIFKLRWDNELATFAQVLANQCVLRHDMCRATKRFPDPGQTAGLVRFSYPDWYPVSQAGYFETPGLSEEKIGYAITQTIKSWYAQKTAVTASMITKYPDFTYTPNSQGRLYLEVVDGAATHMGCGISAYSEYVYYDNRGNVNYNSIQVICNYSSRPRKGSMVYNTTPPERKDRLSQKCGCPLSSKEDDGCLCQSYEPIEPPRIPNLGPVPQIMNQNFPPGQQHCPENDPNCEPTVVLLPIFTVEDVTSPPNHENLRASRNSTIVSKNSMEIFEAFEKYDNSHGHKLKTAIMEHHDEELPKSIRPLPPARKPSSDVKNRYFEGHLETDSQHIPSSKASSSHGIFNPVNKKSSIFTRAAQFHLPTHSNNYDPFQISINDVKKDVPARKDFSNVQNLVKSYMSSRRDFDPHKADFSDHDHATNTALLQKKPIHPLMGNTESFLNNAEEKLISYNDLFQPRNATTGEPSYPNIQNLNEETDNKLLKLLDNLEQEVKHTELHDHEKEIFDAKIRKIYGKVVGKPVELLTRTQTDKIKEMEPDFMDNELKDNFLKHKPISRSPHPDTNKLNQKQTNLHRYEDRITKSVENDKQIDDIDSGLNGQSHKYNPYSRSTSRNRGPLSRYHERPKKEYKENRFNKLHSDEDYKLRDYDRHNYEFETKNRNTYNFDERNSFRPRNFEMPKHRNNRHDERMKNSNYYLNNDDAADEPMSVERRRYYQDKLENLEKRLHNARGIVKRRNEQEIDHHTRRMRPPIDDMQMRPSRSKNQMDSFYLADRARFLHAF